MKIGRFLISLLILVFSASCAEEDVGKLNFIGDSIIARWPLSETFPSYYTANYGVSGKGISYVESLKGRFTGETVIIEIGTNDNLSFIGESIDDYADQYIDAIIGTGAKTIYLYPVLPRDFKNDREYVNANIEDFNRIIRDRVEGISSVVYLDVYDLFMYENHINYQYYSDGLHLNIYGYEVLSKCLMDNLSIHK